MKKGVFLGALLAGMIALNCTAGERVGEVSYVEGKVVLTRNGGVLQNEPDFGSYLENFDTVTTGANGFVEAVIQVGKGIDTVVKVNKNSIFYIDIASLGGKKKASIELLAGTVSLSVKKLAGTAVEVRTENAVMGVRGTEFTVSTNPSGELLVTCRTGRVECRDDDEKVLFAVPGTVVEKIPGVSFRAIPVSLESLEEFEKNWTNERMEVFKTGALKAVDYYWKEYRKYNGDFRKEYAALTGQWDIISKWMREDKAGTVGGTMELMRDKKALLGPVMGIRKTLAMFEKIYYRMMELEQYYGEGYGRGMLPGGESTATVFAQFDKDATLLNTQMSLVRYVFKLYALRNDGSVPGDETEESPDSFFDSDDSFFDSDF